MVIGVFLLTVSGNPGAGENTGTSQVQPNRNIQLSANSLELNRQTGDQVLSGDVVITRGDISIRANRVTVSTRYGAIYRLRGTGSPIRFEQRLHSGDVIRTQSREIDYVTSQWTLVFTGEVTIQRGKWQVSSGKIEYNIRNRNFRASAEENDDSRVVFVGHPAG